MKKLILALLGMMVAIQVHAAVNYTDFLAGRGHATMSKALEFFVGEHTGDFEGRTPVHFAAMGGHTNTLKNLIGSGKNPSVQDIYRNMPLHFAAVSGNIATLHYLLGKTSNTDIVLQNCAGKTPVHFAVSANQPAAVKWLLDNISKKDQQYFIATSGPSILFEAAERGHANMLETLFNFGLDPTLRDRNGNYALHKAAAAGHSNVVQTLLTKAPEMVNWIDGQGNTALHYAAQSAREDALKTLIENGANNGIRNDSQKTPLETYMARKHEGTSVPYGKRYRIQKLLGGNPWM